MRGIPSFLGAPIADVEDLRPGDVGMAGLFLDHGEAERFGKRFAARQIRYASAAVGVRPPEGPRGRCLDLGDLNVFPLEPARQQSALMRQLRLVVAVGAVPLLVGGRGLPFRLCDCLPVGQNFIVGGDLLGSAAAGPLALIVDLARSVGPKARPRELATLLETIVSVPAECIGAVHICGVAPDLDVDGRREASLAASVLEVLASHLVGGRPCR
jgi:hypothetical protein